MDFLQREYFPGQWRREEPDFLMSEVPAGSEWTTRLAFLEQVQSQYQAIAEGLIMALPTVEHGLKQLIQGPLSVRVVLDNGSTFAISDPALLVRSFPADFPRAPLGEQPTRLRLRQAGGRTVDVSPQQIKPGTLIGLSEIESVQLGQETLAPEEWLKRTLRALKVKLPKGEAPGLIREARGLFLFPGIPLARVRGVAVGAVTFSHLLDMGQLGASSPYFAALLAAVEQAAKHQRQRWQLFNRRNRLAESKRDLPIVCGGAIPLLNDSLAGLLQARGFARCSSLVEPREGQFREPTLLLQCAPWGGAGLGAQVEPPLVFPVAESLAPALRPLEGLTPLAQVAFVAPQATPVALDPADFARQKEQLLARAARAQAGLGLAEKRLLLLRQEVQSLAGSQAHLAELLEARDTLHIWDGSLSGNFSQALVFSHDQEEAGAVLQALGSIAKKRWFDLSPYSAPEAIRSLSLDPVREYLRDGIIIITAASREKLTELRRRLEDDLGTVRTELQECEDALRFYSEEMDKIEAATHNLVRRWVWQSLEAWLDVNYDAVLREVDALRRRHERQWFSRSLISRVLIISSSGENRPPLLDACRQFYPRFNAELSVLVPYDYEPLDALPAPERNDLIRRGREEGLDSRAIQARLRAELERQNEARFNDYQEVLTTQLHDLHADLVLIEHRGALAGRLLELVRARLPALAHVPAVLIVPEYWAPAEDAALPWPLARVVVLRRMGPLTAQDCVEHLHALHPA
jgi:hypothetical protein